MIIMHLNGRLEMSTFDAEQNEDGNVKLIWNASIECPTIKGECNQYYFENGKWIFMGTYEVPTDYAVDIVCTNVDVDDSIENNILKVNDTLFSQYDFSQYPLVVDEPLIDMKCAYIEVIRQARFNFPSYDDEYGYCGYYTKDIDNNGVEELFVFTGTCEQDAKVTAYTFTNGNLAKLGELSMTHSGIYREGNSFCKIEKYNGKTQGYKFSIVNNALAEDEISLYSLIGSYYSLDHGYSFNNLSHITNLARN